MQITHITYKTLGRW